jgi:hypothetical protein
VGWVVPQLRKHVSEVLHHHWHQLGEEACRRVQHLLPVTHGAAQDAAQYVPDGKGVGSDEMHIV